MGGGGGGTKQDFVQSERFATIARGMWADYNKRFVPEENKLISAIGTEEVDARNNMGMAADTVNQTFGAQQGAMDRTLSRYGVTPTAPQATASARTLDMARTGTLANTENAVRLGIKDRNIGIMTGGISGARTFPELQQGAK
jgi:hypothetical protein